MADTPYNSAITGQRIDAAVLKAESLPPPILFFETTEDLNSASGSTVLVNGRLAYDSERRLLLVFHGEEGDWAPAVATSQADITALISRIEVLEATSYLIYTPTP